MLLNLEVAIKSSVMSAKTIHRRKWLPWDIVTLKGVKRSIVRNTKRLECSYHGIITSESFLDKRLGVSSRRLYARVPNSY